MIICVLFYQNFDRLQSSDLNAAINQTEKEIESTQRHINNEHLTNRSRPTNAIINNEPIKIKLKRTPAKAVNHKKKKFLVKKKLLKNNINQKKNIKK